MLLPFDVLYEDNHLIAINKKSSDLVQGDKTGDTSLDTLVKQYLKEKYQKPFNVYLGVTHRIDRPVSGIVLFAKTSKALSRMNEMFREHQVKKLYWAIVKEKPELPEATIIHFLRRDAGKNKSFASVKPVPGSKEASLTYHILASADNYHLIEVDLHSGRHHQIRCQLAAIGCPIKGDLKYGFPRSNDNGGISLHAVKMEFMHPVKNEPIKIIAIPPKDSLWDYFCKINKDLYL